MDEHHSIFRQTARVFNNIMRAKDWKDWHTYQTDKGIKDVLTQVAADKRIFLHEWALEDGQWHVIVPFQEGFARNIMDAGKAAIAVDHGWAKNDCIVWKTGWNLLVDRCPKMFQATQFAGDAPWKIGENCCVVNMRALFKMFFEGNKEYAPWYAENLDTNPSWLQTHYDTEAAETEASGGKGSKNTKRGEWSGWNDNSGGKGKSQKTSWQDQGGWQAQQDYGATPSVVDSSVGPAATGTSSSSGAASAAAAPAVPSAATQWDKPTEVYDAWAESRKMQGLHQ